MGCGPIANARDGRTAARWIIAIAGLALLLAPVAQLRAAIDPAVAQKLYDRVRSSLVAVQYTFNNEMGRHEYIGQGVIVRDDGLVMVSLQMVPTVLPDEQIVDFKIIVPGFGVAEDKELDATFEGRDERSGVAFVRTREPQKWTSLKFSDETVKVGDSIMSVGLLPKVAGYRPYLSESVVSTTLHGPVPQVLVSTEGLAVLGSPVFDATGNAIGMVNFDADQTVLLNDTRAPLSAVSTPPRLFVPARDFMLSLSDPPTPTHPIVMPWMGVSHLTGLKKEVADYYDLKGAAAVQVGDVIAGYAAEKAGLKPGDVIVKLDGKPLERGDEPDESAGILMRKLQRMKPGDTVTLSLLKAKDQPLKEVKVVLDARPKQANKAARYFADDLGFTARESVIEDTYERKLSPDTQGVVISFIRPNSAAQSAHLQIGDFVTKLNQTPVTSLDEFKKQYDEFRKDHPKDGVVMEVVRRDSTQVIRIEPPQ